MTDRRGHSPAYRAAQLAARAREGALSAQEIRNVAESLRSYARELTRIIRGLPRGEEFTRRLRETTTLLNRVSRQLEQRLAQSISTNRETSYDTVLGIWKRAGLDAARAGGVSVGLLGAIKNPSITLLGAYEGIGAANWRTLLKQYLGAGAREVDQIVERALLEGVSPDKLARRLFPYVQGAESFESAFGGLGFDPRRLRDPALRNAAKLVRFNATRIAVSEVHNARAEAEVQHFVADPLVRGVFWRLAPDRGPTARTDECDVLASSDFYGEGTGWYPVDAVPLTPHPHDRCERVPQVRSITRIAEPKLLGLQRRSAFTAGRFGRKVRISKSRGQTIRASAENLLRLTDTKGPDVRMLVNQVA